VTVGDGLDEADPQADPRDERGDEEPFMKGERTVGFPARRRRVNADIINPYISVHREYSRDSGASREIGDGVTSARRVTRVRIFRHEASTNIEAAARSHSTKAGSTVVWTNDDSLQHEVAFDGNGIISSVLNQHDTFSHMFPTAGTYHYICSIHPFMHGTVIVTA
jgi:plastocyanin